MNVNLVNFQYLVIIYIIKYRIFNIKFNILYLK